jgi:hypothetical protein
MVRLNADGSVHESNNTGNDGQGLNMARCYLTAPFTEADQNG